MPIVNLFDRCSGMMTLQEIYHVPDPVMGSIMKRCIIKGVPFWDITDNCVIIFLEETGIHPDTFDVSDVKVHCKHITTAFDGGKSIMKNGLMPLNVLLEKESVLSTFLKENGITISPFEQYIVIKGEKYWIPESSVGTDVDEWERFRFLSPAIYHDHGEVEAFISGEKKEILEYSTVRNYPEILASIGDTVKNIKGYDPELGSRWIERNPITFIADFDVRLNDLSYHNGMRSRKDNPDYYWELEKYFEIENNQESESTWQNEWIIRSCFYNSCPGVVETLCAVGIKSDVVIPGETITLTSVR